VTRPDSDRLANLAACRGVPVTVFYPEIGPGASPGQIVRAYATARTYCESCPVKTECLAYCLPFEKETGRRDGMWGGLTPQERARMVRSPRT